MVEETADPPDLSDHLDSPDLQESSAERSENVQHTATHLALCNNTVITVIVSVEVGVLALNIVLSSDRVTPDLTDLLVETVLQASR